MKTAQKMFCKILTAPSDIKLPIFSDKLLKALTRPFLIGKISMSNLLPISLINLIIFVKNENNCSVNTGIKEITIIPSIRSNTSTIIITAKILKISFHLVIKIISI